eukprot:1152148-Pelagomonas_calceolata.AAC.1
MQMLSIRRGTSIPFTHKEPGRKAVAVLSQLQNCLAGVVLLTSSLRLILRSTRCEEGVGGLFGLAGQG